MEKTEIGDINVIALTVSTILGFLSVHSSIIERPLFKWFDKPSSTERELRQQRLALKNEQVTLNQVDQFAKYSKLQRKINAIDEDLQQIKSSKTTNSIFVRVGFTYGVRFFFGMLLFIFSIYYRRTPVFWFGERFNLFPITNFACYPNGTNYISFYFWGMCSIAAANLINLF